MNKGHYLSGSVVVRRQVKSIGRSANHHQHHQQILAPPHARTSSRSAKRALRSLTFCMAKPKRRRSCFRLLNPVRYSLCVWLCVGGGCGLWWWCGRWLTTTSITRTYTHTCVLAPSIHQIINPFHPTHLRACSSKTMSSLPGFPYPPILALRLPMLL